MLLDREPRSRDESLEQLGSALRFGASERLEKKLEKIPSDYRRLILAVYNL
jgi:DNA-directed RNA polymerase specialized sigma24 family protein